MRRAGARTRAGLPATGGRWGWGWGGSTNGRRRLKLNGRGAPQGEPR